MPIVPADVPDTAPAAVPAHPQPEEALLLRWFRQIIDGVAEALDRLSHVDHRLTPNPDRDLPVIHLLHTAFTINGHRVEVTVDWYNPWREPRSTLTVDGAAVAVDTTTVPSAAALAYAAWQAVTDTTTTTTAGVR
jgi:hypothetical protein